MVWFLLHLKTEFNFNYSSSILEIVFSTLILGDGRSLVDDFEYRDPAYDELFEWFLTAPIDPAERIRKILLLYIFLGASLKSGFETLMKNYPITTRNSSLWIHGDTILKGSFESNNDCFTTVLREPNISVQLVDYKFCHYTLLR